MRRRRLQKPQLWADGRTEVSPGGLLRSAALPDIRQVTRPDPRRMPPEPVRDEAPLRTASRPARCREHLAAAPSRRPAKGRCPDPWARRHLGRWAQNPEIPAAAHRSWPAGADWQRPGFPPRPSGREVDDAALRAVPGPPLRGFAPCRLRSSLPSLTATSRWPASLAAICSSWLTCNSTHFREVAMSTTSRCTFVRVSSWRWYETSRASLGSSGGRSTDSNGTTSGGPRLSGAASIASTASPTVRASSGSVAWRSMSQSRISSCIRSS